MFQNKSIGVVVLKIFQYFVEYISYSFYSFFIIELFAICVIIVTGSGFEKLFIKTFISTLPLNLGAEKGTFTIGNREVMQIMAFWALVVMMVSKIFEKIVKIKINYGVYYTIFTMLHVVAVIRLWNVDGMWLIILFFYTNSLVCNLIYRGIKKASNWIQNIFGWYFE